MIFILYQISSIRESLMLLFSKLVIIYFAFSLIISYFSYVSYDLSSYIEENINI